MVLVAVLRELRVVLGQQCGWVLAVVLVYVTHGGGGIYAKIGCAASHLELGLCRILQASPAAVQGVHAAAAAEACAP